MKIKATIIIEAKTREDIDQIIDLIEVTHTWANEDRTNETSVEIIEKGINNEKENS